MGADLDAVWMLARLVAFNTTSVRAKRHCIDFGRPDAAARDRRAGDARRADLHSSGHRLSA